MKKQTRMDRTRFFSKLLAPPIPRALVPLYRLLPSSRIPIDLRINFPIVTRFEIQHRGTTTSQDDPFNSWCMAFDRFKDIFGTLDSWLKEIL